MDSISISLLGIGAVCILVDNKRIFIDAINDFHKLSDAKSDDV